MAELQPNLLQSGPHVISNDEHLRDVSPGRRSRAKSQTIRLIRDISPSTAQNAFHTGTLTLGGDDDTHVGLDLTTCTFAEKDLGLRVTRAAERLRAWCAEIGQWQWSGSFDDKPQQGKVDGGVGDAGKSLEAIEAEVNTLSVGTATGTSSPALSIAAREQRLDEISHELDQLEYDELKDHVLTLHHGKPRTGSSYPDFSVPNLSMMDDYTILVTHILMQSLPNLFQLKQHLDTWLLRLAVLRQSPGFLTSLSQAQRGMQLAWQILGMPERVQEHGVNAQAYSQAVENIKKVLSKKCHQLGQALDNMLDKLEGRQDKLPERWIDDFEAFESEYSEWTVKAHQSVFELDMQEEQRKRVESQIRRGDSDLPSPSSEPLMPSDTLRDKLPTAVHEPLLADPGQGLVPDQKMNSRDAVQTAQVALREQADTVLMRRASMTSLRSISSNDVRRVSIVRSPISSGHATPLRIRSSIDENRSQTSPTSLAERAAEQLMLVYGNRLAPSTTSIVPLRTSIETTAKASEDNATVGSLKHPDRLPRSLMEADSTAEPPTSPTTSTTPMPAERPRTPDDNIKYDPPQDPQTPASIPSTIDSMPSPQESPSKRAGWKPQHGILNAVMSKRRDRYKENLTKKSPQKSPQKGGSQQLTAQDMEQQISNILTTLPTPIKLETRRGFAGTSVTGPRSRPASGTQGPGRSRAPSLTLARAATPLPSAESDKPASTMRRARKSGSAEEPEIQLYHLSSSKGFAPTKLYIRRVGENGERLMVRVGGGWADLADYLLQYAEHHGRRAVSGSHDAVQVLDMQATAPTGSSTPGQTSSGEGTASANVSRRSSPGAKMLLEAFAPSPANNGNTNTPNESTPQSVGSNGLRRSLGPGEGGASLAGPHIKKFDPSGETQEWIDGMVEKAKKANSIDVNKLRKGDEFADIGKVGNTKRVYMKNQ